MKNTNILLLKNFDSMSIDYFYDFINRFKIIPDKFGHLIKNVECDDRIIGDFELVYIENGKCLITIENIEYTCEKGDALLITPFKKHKMYSDNTMPISLYYIHFDVLPIYLHNEFISAMQPFANQKLKLKNSQLLYSLLRIIEKEIEKSKTGYKIIYETILIQIITMLYRDNGMKLNKKGVNNKYKYYVSECGKYIYNNISSKITAEDLCNELNISHAVLCKAFNILLNISPTYFIQLIKIKYSEQLLKTTELNISEVSNKLGFSSPYYFSKVFKSFFGVSPQNYINK